MRNIPIVLLSLAALFAGGCVNRAAQAQAKRTEQILRDPTKPVTVTPVVTRTLSEMLEVTGEVTTSDDTNVGAKNPGRIVAVYVRDGDPVAAGQLIAAQDTTTQSIALQQAQAQVSAAQAAMSQARQNALVGPQRSTAALETARAQLRSAQAQLKKAQAGARPEERRQAENAVAAAQSSMDTAKKQLDRTQGLFDAGATSRQALEIAQNAYQASLAQYRSALEQLNIARAGSRSEDLTSAEQAVRQAEEAVRSAQAQKRLDSLLDEQVRSAEANLRSAQAQVALVNQQIADAQIRAPFAGRVFGKPVQAGAVVGAGTPVARIIGSSGVYFDGEAPETAVGSIRVGSRVSIELDSAPGKSHEGEVQAISPAATNIGRLFKVRIRFLDVPADVKPGMFARGQIAVRTVRDAAVVPASSIVRQGGEDYVFTSDGNTAKRTKVVRGLQQDGIVQVSGVAVGAQVVTQGQNDLEDGTKIRIEAPKSDATDQSAKSGN